MAYGHRGPCPNDCGCDVALEIHAARAKSEVDHPAHYTGHPSGVECITITEHMGFNLGNAVKYIWRADLKSDDPITDLMKAKWYIEREIARRQKCDLTCAPPP